MTSETELRDHLAIDRTNLANERTFLAYIRTGLTLIVTGAGTLEFFDTSTAHLVGWAFLVAGGLTVPLGLWRFLRVRKALRESRSASGAHPD